MVEQFKSLTYVSRYSELTDGCLVSEPLKFKRSRAQVPFLESYRCVGVYNASRKTCHGLELHLTNGTSVLVNLPMNESYFPDGNVSFITLGTPFIWCYALYDRVNISSAVHA
jgi:hypothetical protein